MGVLEEYVAEIIAAYPDVKSVFITSEYKNGRFVLRVFPGLQSEINNQSVLRQLGGYAISDLDENSDSYDAHVQSMAEDVARAFRDRSVFAVRWRDVPTLVSRLVVPSDRDAPEVAVLRWRGVYPDDFLVSLQAALKEWLLTEDSKDYVWSEKITAHDLAFGSAVLRGILAKYNILDPEIKISPLEDFTRVWRLNDNILEVKD